jgi:hypothetical protein
MTFEKGNKLWQMRSKDGKEPKYKPDALWEKALEYFQWVMQLFAYQGKVIEKDVPKMRAMTFQGLELFLDIAHGTWENYKKKNDYLTITRAIEKIIYEQKFTGAAAALLNPNIIARDLGLRDNQDVSLKGDITITDNTDLGAP